MVNHPTDKITLPEREWRKLAHARMIGVVMQYGRDATVIDEDIVKPWAATGIYRLGLERLRGFVIVRFNRETLRELLSTDETTAFMAYNDWRAVTRSSVG
jgi:hypothetical protein